jgi:hypothetical protein
MKYLMNAFSIGCLDFVNETQDAILTIEIIPEASFFEDAKDAISRIGHADTAELLSAMAGYPIKMERQSTSLVPGDIIYVAQYNGPRLPEEAKSLPDGAKFRFYIITIKIQEHVQCSTCCHYFDDHYICDRYLACIGPLGEEDPKLWERR